MISFLSSLNLGAFLSCPSLRKKTISKPPGKALIINLTDSDILRLAKFLAMALFFGPETIKANFDGVLPVLRHLSSTNRPCRNKFLFLKNKPSSFLLSRKSFFNINLHYRKPVSSFGAPSFNRVFAHRRPHSL